MSDDGKISLEAKTYFDIALKYQERLVQAEAGLNSALGELAVIHDITQDQNVSALDKVDNIAATAASALFGRWNRPEPQPLGLAQPPKEHRWAIEDRENAERNARLQRERDAARASAQKPTKPWVCCNCDADLSCGACGVEQPNDSAYYEGLIKENEALKAAQCARCAIADTWGVPDYPRACVNCGKVAPASVSRGAYLCKEDHPDQDMYACTIDMTYDEAMDEIRRLGGRIADRIRDIESLEAKLSALTSTVLSPAAATIGDIPSEPRPPASHDITQDPNVLAIDKIDNIAATAASALTSHRGIKNDTETANH
jgi:hypothetical protein